MIEGINASVAISALVRPVVDQVESVSSYAANPTQVQRMPQVPYISPYVSIDYTYDKAVLQLRDAQSGEVVQQIPSDTQLRAYRRAAEQQPVIFENKQTVVTEKAQAENPASTTATVSSSVGSSIEASAPSDTPAPTADTSAVLVDTSA